jgi:two-component system cell cycle sensor histidine kinase/response regulator CckA
VNRGESRLATGSALLAATLGAAVLLAWILDLHPLLQAGTGTVPIQFNAGLALLCAGLGLAALERGAPRIAALLMVPVLVLALPALYQEIAGTDVGIDQSLWRHGLAAEGVPPGRMAANTAFAFLLVAAAVAAALPARPRAGGRLLGSLAGVLVATVVLVVLAGYLFDVPLARAWGQRTPMALLTAVGLGLLAVALLARGWAAWSPLSVRTRVLSLAGGALAASLALAGWLALDAALMRGVERALDSDADRLATLLDLRGNRFLATVPALARRLSALGRKPEDADFMREAALHDEIFEVSPIIGWNAPDGTVRVLVSRELDRAPYAHVEGSSALLDAARTEAFRTALAERRPALSGRTRLASTGTSSLILFAPVVIDDAEAGVVGAALDLERLFGELLLLADEDYALAVHDGEDLLWQGRFERRPLVAFARERSIHLGGRSLTLDLAPHADLLVKTRGNLPELVLMIGLVAAGLLSLTLALAGLARQRMALAQSSQRALELAEHRAGRILDSITDGFLGIDRDWRCVRVNAQALGVFAMDEQDLLGRRVADVFPALAGSETEARLRAAMASGEPCSFETHFGARSAWFEVRVFPFEEGLNVYFRDVSERKAARERLERSEARYRHMFQASPLPMWVTDKESGRVLDVNGAATSHYRWPRETFLGLTMQDLRVAGPDVSSPGLEWHRRGDGSAILVALATHPLDFEGRRAELVQVQDLTERVRAERALKERESYLSALMETQPECVKLVSPEGRVMDMNRAGLAMVEADSAAAVVGRRVDQLIHPDDREAFLALHRRVIAGESGRLKFRIVGLRGGERWMDTHAVPLRDGSGAIIGALGVTRDVTEIERRERALLRLAQIIDQIHDAVAEVDMAGIVRSWNKGAERMLGFTAEEMIGQPIERIYPEDWKERRQTLVIEPLLARGEHHVEVEHVRKDGSRVWAHLSLTLLRDEQGEPVGSLGYSIDITRRRMAEEGLRLQQRAIEASANGIVIVDAAARDLPIRYVNPAFEEITGYRAAEVLGRNCRFLQGTDRGQPERTVMREAIAAGEPCSVVLRNYRKDGSLFWNEISISPVHDDAGRLSHFVGIQTDISERRRLEERLQHAQRMESIGQLTGGIAHDFNNLLTVIQGNAELLSERLAAAPAERMLADMIGSAADRGASLTQRLLAFARRQALAPQPVDVLALLQGLDGLLRRSLGEEIEIALEADGRPWPALVDPAQLESALLNLCLNARDAMHGGGRLVIRLENRTLDVEDLAPHPGCRPGDYLEVAVIDDGVGIAAEVLPRVFEPFFTTKEKGKGTGLGLAMVYGFVTQSGGHVEIESQPGKGTQVRLRLPRANAVALPDGAKAPSGAAIAQGSAVILLVEDDALVRRYACDQLASLGYQVIEAASGPEAMKLLETRSDIALLFTDVVMPGGMSGRQLAEAARRLRPALRVLYTSGYSEDEISHGGRLDPDVHLLAKPYRRAELAQRVAEALA